jgi:hypothetical protein
VRCGRVGAHLGEGLKHHSSDLGGVRSGTAGQLGQRNGRGRPAQMSIGPFSADVTGTRKERRSESRLTLIRKKPTGGETSRHRLADGTRPIAPRKATFYIERFSLFISNKIRSNKAALTMVGADDSFGCRSRNIQSDRRQDERGLGFSSYELRAATRDKTHTGMGDVKDIFVDNVSVKI